MFIRDMSTSGGFFNDAIWDQFLSISGECGFESYYVRERLEVMEPMNSPQSAEDTRDALKFKSNLEQVNNIFWRLKESNDTQGLEKLTAILENVILEHKG